MIMDSNKYLPSNSLFILHTVYLNDYKFTKLSLLAKSVTIFISFMHRMYDKSHTNKSVVFMLFSTSD